MIAENLPDSRTRWKVRSFAVVCLVLGVAGSIDPLIGYAKAWGLVDGSRAQHSQGLLGLLLGIGAAGLFFLRKWGQVVLSLSFGCLFVFGAIGFVQGVFLGKLMHAGLAALFGGLAFFAVRFLAQAQVQALLAKRGLPSKNAFRRTGPPRR